MDSNGLTPIYLSTADAARYQQFCKYESMFNLMLAAGVFDIKNGQAIINFNQTGTLANIEIKVKAYDYRHIPNELSTKDGLT